MSASSLSPLRPADARSELRLHTTSSLHELKVLDRSKFNRSVSVIALRVIAARTEALIKPLYGALLAIPRQRPVIVDPADDALRLVLLAPEVVSQLDLATLTPSQRAAVDAAGPAIAVEHTLHLGYDQCSLEDVLRQVIPASLGLDLPSAFETAGHVAHLNLRDEFLPWRRVIAQAILDKNPVLRTVVQKTGAIHEKFRTYPMELLAGVDDTLVTVRECGATYRFDLARVYWNSRLGHEHEVMSRDLIRKGAVVADMFCGVGPFAIPLAMRGCVVHANDLNPDSFAALQDNVRRNKVGGRVTCYNLDGGDFLRQLAKNHVAVDAVIMNLPADAISFLGVFRGLFAADADGGASSVNLGGASSVNLNQSNGGASSVNLNLSNGGASSVNLPLPRVHVYCFSKSETIEEARVDVARRVLAELGLPPPVPLPTTTAASVAAADATASDVASSDYVLDHANRLLTNSLVIRGIRDVAPRKIMCCASFDLPAAVAFEVRDGGSAMQGDVGLRAAAGPRDAAADADSGNTEAAPSKRARRGIL